MVLRVRVFQCCYPVAGILRGCLQPHMHECNACCKALCMHACVRSRTCVIIASNHSTHMMH